MGFCPLKYTIPSAAALVMGALAPQLPTAVRAAQSPPANMTAHKPPRIGLALSGGGARGAAHIGVLKVLKELRVPVHCVTGTSMGAIVGGSFASGAEPSKLEKIVRATDWSKVFTDRPPRAEIATRRKLDDYKTLFAPEWGVKDGGLVAPKGVLAGLSIEAFFRKLTESSVEVNEIQSLPVPFRAVAADIETGNAVVLDRGSVSQAMRASMSVPGLMAPVEINGRLLVDGGIADNLPIDEARKLCADVVIAVNISTPPLKRAEISSAVSVALQLVNLLGKATVERQLKSLTEQDVLITPDLGDISAGNFDRSVEAIAIGEKAARAVADKLRRYSITPEQYAALTSGRVRVSRGSGTVDEIRFEGLQRTNPEVLHSLVQSKPGEPLSQEKIGADLRRIYGRGDFESVDYRLLQEPGRRVMLIHPREKDWGPDYLRFGLGFSSEFRGDSPFTALVSYRRTWLNRLGGEWLTEARMGRDPQLFSEFYQPLDERGRFFIAPYGSVGRTSRGIFVGDRRVARYDTREARIGIDGGAVLGTWGEFRLGPLWRHVNANVDTGSPLLPSISEDSAGVRARLFVDQLDQPFFPSRGYRAYARAYVADEALGSERNYKRIDGEFTVVASQGPHNFKFTVLGGSDLSSEMPAYESYRLGGPLRLSGYLIDEFAGRRMAFGRVLYYNRTLPLPEILGSGVYFGGSIEVGRVRSRFDNLPDAGWLWSGSVFLAADTFAGPGFLGLGTNGKGRWNMYIILGVP